MTVSGCYCLWLLETVWLLLSLAAGDSPWFLATVSVCWRLSLAVTVSGSYILWLSLSLVVGDCLWLLLSLVVTVSGSYILWLSLSLVVGDCL